jgi:DNA repair protein Mre11
LCVCLLGFGEKQLDLEFLSDESELFPYPYTCNYLDSNYNVSLPVFSIHGNHDDPAGQGNLCALDLLSISGLVNYFGKQALVDDISIKPLLLKKGDTRVAIYGLGNIRDERLHRSFRDGKVKFYRPEDSVTDKDSWFNLFVLHQNRAQHSSHNYIPSHFIKDWFDLGDLLNKFCGDTNMNALLIPSRLLIPFTLRNLARRSRHRFRPVKPKQNMWASLQSATSRLN